MRILILLMMVTSMMGCAGLKQYLTEPRNKSYYEQFSPDLVHCHPKRELKVCRQFGRHLICQCYNKAML